VHDSLAPTRRRHIITDPSDLGPDLMIILIEAARLDAGRLGLWWAGIALVTAAAVAIAAPRRGVARGVA
jgi:hypothetical protein